MQSYSKESKGFTLIEVLVVVTIIAVLIAINLLAIDRYQRKANDTAVSADLGQIRKLAAMIYSDENSYRNICDGVNATINDANSEFPELKIIEDDVREIIGSDPECHAARIEYCVITALLSGRYFCADATGFAGEIDTDNCVDIEGSRNCSL